MPQTVDLATMGPALQPFPLLALDDLVLQHVLTFLNLLERKAVRATCRKLCKVASAAVRHFHVEKVPGDTYLEYLNLHEKFPNVQVVSLADELVTDRPFAALVTLTLCKLKNLSSIILLNASMALSAAGMATLAQCKHIKQLVLAPPLLTKGPLMSANTQAITTIISQLPGLTHLLLLPSGQGDPATASAAGGQAHQGTAVSSVAGRHRDWQLNEPALRSLGCLHGLVQLEVGADPAALADIRCLASLSNLRRLAIRGLSLEAGDCLGVLHRLPALRSLSLVGSAISEDSLAHVGRCYKLTRLELQGCHRLRETGLNHLMSLHQLTCFRCSMQLTETGLSILASTAGSRLVVLEADSIEVLLGDQHPAGGHVLPAHPAPQPAAPAAGFPSATAAFAHATTAHGSIHTSTASASSASALSHAGSGSLGQLGPQLPALRVLRLRRLPSGCPPLWQFAPGLMSLVVWGEANNAGLTRAFSGHCALQRLALCCEATSDAGLAAVSSLTRLRDLTLCAGVSISPQRLISVLQRLPRLQALQLSHMRNLSDESLAVLVAVAGQLQALGLQEPGRVSDQGFALLAALNNLKSLWVDCCKLSMPVLMALACHPSLTLLEVHQSHPEAECLGSKQLELLGRVKGPSLDVVLREGSRSRDEVLRPQIVPGVSGVKRDGEDLTGATVLIAEPAAVGFAGQELVLQHGFMMGGGPRSRAVGGQGGMQLGMVGDAVGLQDADLQWPDLGGLQV